MRAGLVILLLAAVSLLRAETVDWLRLPPEQFFRRAELNARIDLAVFDRSLLSAAIFHETNRQRRQLGLPLFRPLPQAVEAADLQANWNSVAARADHKNPIPGLESVMDRVRHTGLYPAKVAENLAMTPLYDVGDSTEIGIRHDGVRTIYVSPVTGEPLSVHTYASFATSVVLRWMNSPGHRANIVDPAHQYIGCSVRPTKGVSGADLLCSAQVFVTLREADAKKVNQVSTR